MGLDLSPEECEAAGIKTPYPGFWVWIMCWPLAVLVALVALIRNGKCGPDGS